MSEIKLKRILSFWWESGVFQCVVLAAASFLCVLPRLWTVGTNVVTNTYRVGTLRFFSNGNPYALPLEGGDRFEYSPFFCLLYAPFAYLPARPQAISWAAFNCAFFWIGIYLWIRSEKMSAWLLLAIIVASMELNISLLYQQINAFLVGITLIGIALFRDRRWFLSGLLLSIATNVKTLPGLFALSLLFSLRRNYGWGIALGALLCLLAPALFLGLTRDYALHFEWVLALLRALGYTRWAQLDIGSVLVDRGFRYGRLVQYAVLGISIMFLAAPFLLRRAKDFQTSWYLWLVVGLAGLLLMSPRSESPTFVLIAPAYLFITYELRRLPSTGLARWLGLITLLVSMFLVTICFTDLWWKAIWDPLHAAYASKTVGTLALWTLAIFLFGYRERRFRAAGATV